MLSDEWAGVRGEAVGALQAWRAADHADAVKRLMQDIDPYVRRRVAEALCVLSKDAAAARPLAQDAMPWVRSRATLALARRGIAPPAGDDPDWEADTAMRIARLRLGLLDGAAQRALVDEVMRRAMTYGDRLAEELVDALTAVHERAAYQKLHEVRGLSAIVASPDDLGRLVAASGLKIADPPVGVCGLLEKGVPVSTWDAMLLLARPSGAFVSGDTLRFMTCDDALAAWRKRLE
jgi:hypothetical protein